VSQPLKGAGIALAGAALIAGFIVAGFPYDRLGEYIEAEVQQATGVALTIGTLEPSLGFAGLGLRANGLSLRWPEGELLTLDTARLRPAWSLSWLRGVPAIRAQLAGPLGEADGTLSLNGFGAWNGDFHDLDLAGLPIESVWPDAALEGSAEASVDLRMGDAGLEGRVTFEAHDGTVVLPTLPMALPYDGLSGDIEFGGDVLATVKSLDLAGPLLSAEVTGTVGHAPVFANAPLSLSVVVRAQPGVRPLLEAAGLRVKPDGSARVIISGTTSNPVVR
jgi:type II secretion system protein N